MAAELPRSVEAEQAVLGGLFIDNSHLPGVKEVLAVEDFTKPEHRLIYRAMLDLDAARQPLDLMTVADRLEDNKALNEAGGFGYLGVLVRDTPSAANVQAYAAAVKRHSRRRQLAKLGTDLARWATEEPDPESTLARLQRALSAIDAAGLAGPVPIKEFVASAVEEIDIRFHRDIEVTGVPTGYPDLDKLLLGLQRGRLYVIAGRTGMGKSLFASNIAEFVAIEVHASILIFSQEMTGEENANRMLASLGMLDHRKIQTGRLEDADWPRLTNAIATLSEANIWVDETPGLEIDALLSRARRLHRQVGNLGLIVVDHIGLIRAGGENRTREVSAIVIALKNLAKELSVPVIALCQINRSVEQRNNPRPMLSDLRESGEIEQSADVVMLLYREEVYNPNTPNKGVVEVNVAKHRNGPEGLVYLAHRAEFMRFETLAREAIPERQPASPAFRPRRTKTETAP